MAKRKSTTFLLSELFEGEITSLEQLEEVTKVYQEKLDSTKYIIPTDNTLAFMLAAKRDKITFGPYQNLSFFEMSNRIYSDLVLLEAAKILFKEHEVKNVQLKMSNHSGNDLTVIDKDNNVIVGEAFNTACSYFQVKMRSELQKFKENKVGIIAFNTCALDDKNRFYFEKKKVEFPNLWFIECKI